MVVGADEKIDEIATYLQRSGYTESKINRLGWYRTLGDAIENHPGPDGYLREGGLVQVQGGRIVRIESGSGHTSLTQLSLEPEVITNFFDQSRQKQLIVHFNEIPRVLVDAVLSAEDKRFFRHWGFDPAGILRAAWVDAKERRRSQGASTLTQQLARTLWLGQERG